jgi:hypothetical protein
MGLQDRLPGVSRVRGEPKEREVARALRHSTTSRAVRGVGGRPPPFVVADIVEIMETTNRQKPRTEILRILRGHTPNVQDTG